MLRRLLDDFTDYLITIGLKEDTVNKYVFFDASEMTFADMHELGLFDVIPHGTCFSGFAPTYILCDIIKHPKVIMLSISDYAYYRLESSPYIAGSAEPYRCIDLESIDRFKRMHKCSS